MRRYLLSLLVLLSVAIPGHPDSLRADRDASTLTSGPVDDWSRLAGRVVVSGELGSFLDGSYSVAGRERLPSGAWRLHVAPPPAFTTSSAIQAVVEPVPLIFRDDFEARDLWRWSEVIGALWGGYRLNPHGLYWVLRVTDGTDKYLFGTVAGHSAAGDTPANTRIRPGLSFDLAADWKAYTVETDARKRAAFKYPGGLVSHGTYSFTVQNRRDPTTRKGRLDDLLAVDFRNQEAELFACYPTHDGDHWRPSPLAGSLCGVATRGKVTAAGFDGSAMETYSFSVRGQEAGHLGGVENTPVELTGLARGVKMEDGGPAAGPEIRRADTASLYDHTTDQWLAWIFARPVDDASSAVYTVYDSPIWRLRRDESNDAVDVEARRNSDGAWVKIGDSVSAPNTDLGDAVGVLVNYDVGTTTATLYRDGAANGSATLISGGLYASGSGDLILYSNPSAGTSTWVWLAARQGQRLLDAAEIEDRCMFAFRPHGEASLTMALEFNQGLGSTIDDLGSEGVDAQLNNFADADGAWVETGFGEPGDAHFRPPVIIGRPYSLPLKPVGVTQRIYSGGFTETRAIAGHYRAITSGGGRLTPTDGGGVRTCTFTAPNRIDGFPMEFEPATGAKYTASGTVSNNQQFTIARVLLDPRSGAALGPSIATGSVIVEEAVTTEAAVSTTWTSDSTDGWERWVPADVNDGPATGNVSKLLLAQLKGDYHSPLAGLLSRRLGIRALAEEFLEDAGPTVATVSKFDLLSMTTDAYGWIGEGDGDAEDSAHILARSTPATDGSPSAVGWSHGSISAASSPYLAGFQRSPASADWTWPEVQIESAEPRFDAARFVSVRVRYSPSWTAQEDLVNSPAAAAEDAAVRESLVAWLDVQRGSGTPRLRIDTYLHDPDDAAAHADAMLDIVTNGRPYIVRLRSPRPLAEVTQILANDVADVTLSSDAYLSGGRKGCIVSYSLRRDGSATALVYFVGP
jgi:hypothetical protein